MRFVQTATLTMLALLGICQSSWAVSPYPAIPAPLRPWLPWVLDAHRDLVCAQLGGQHNCAWPGTLQLDVGDDGGHFSLDVWLDRDDEVILPGDKHAWPLNVSVDGQPTVVEATPDGLARAQLQGGHHVVRGRFSWNSPPEVLSVPESIALLRWSLRDQAVETVKREGDRLFLQQQSQPAAETDTLTVAVARRIQDGVPLRVTTRLTLRVGGKTRELLLGSVLWAGSRPTAVRSPLPVQLGSDGAVRVHGQPGQHVIEIDAVISTPPQELEAPKLQGEFFEPQETWVWQPAESVRSVDLQGLQSVDPERTQLGEDWKKAGRTLLATPGQKLQFKELRRGEAESPPNRLELTRELWLDLPGNGLTARDHVSGDMHQNWRLNAGAQLQVGRVQAESRPLLITSDVTTHQAGVELRQGKVNLEADARIGTGVQDLHIVGWDHDVQRLSATLHLPPGWQLLGAAGVDQVPQTWLGTWTLLEFFFVLMLASGAGRLLGWPWGILALVTLTLCHNEQEAPQWLWLNVLGALALVRALPAHWLKKIASMYHGFSVILLLMALLPFAADQVRFGLHPQAQLGDSQGDRSLVGSLAPSRPMAQAAPDEAKPDLAEMKKEEAEGAAAAPQAAAPAGAKGEPDQVIAGEKRPEDTGGQKAGKFRDSVAAVSKPMQTRNALSSYRLQQVDPNAVVQTGPGVPQWRWHDVPLHWQGPVSKDHVISLYLLSPTLHLWLNLLRAALVIILGLRLLDRARIRQWLAWLRGVPVTVVLAAALLGIGARTAQAQNDTKAIELLGELERRILQAEDCRGPCVTAGELGLEVQGNAVNLHVDIHAQRDASWVLPGPSDLLQIQSVTLDDQETQALRRLPGGHVAVRIPKGVHTLKLRGVLARQSVLTLQLDTNSPPHHVVWHSADWQLDGLDNNGVPEGSLQLSRKAQDMPRSATPGDRETDVELPPWYSVERHLQLGLPWKVTTLVHRDRADRPQLVKIPLLTGESVISDGIRVETVEGGIKVADVQFPRDVQEIAYEAELPVSALLSLKAPAAVSWTETWRLTCSPIWHCQWQGIAPIASQDQGELQPLWQPWPGETVQLQVTRPEGTAGQALTVDAVNYDVTPGQRLLEAVLKLQVRASQGGWRTLTLPAGAQVQSVMQGDKKVAIRPQGQTLRLPVEAGQQQFEIKWQQPWNRSFEEQVPPVLLGGPAANVTTTLHLGEDRWLLWALGPAWGPAVLFWSLVLLVVFMSFFLGRIQGPPLKTWHWLLLGLGCLQLPVFAIICLVGWFLAMASRRRYGLSGPPLPIAAHNLLQVALFGSTLVFLGILYAAIHANLLLEVDMQVAGNGSTGHLLRWYTDRTSDALPSAAMISLPILSWRLAMLLWALWLVSALLRWLPWAWQALSVGGLWLSHPKPAPRKEIPPPPPGRATLPEVGDAPGVQGPKVP